MDDTKRKATGSSGVKGTGMILGVDVHAGYGLINWLAAAAAGVEFMVAKCTLGNDPPGDDRSFRRNVDGAKEAGVWRGAYHFAFPLRSTPGAQAGRGPREQAERAWRVSGELGGRPGELPPALDLEWPPNFERVKGSDALVNRWQEWGITASSIAEWGLEYLDHMERLSGRVPLVYTYPAFWSSLGVHGQARHYARYPLWIATYARSCEAAWVPPQSARPILPAPWPSWTIWQFSADGSPMRIPGIPACPIDRNVFSGSSQDLRDLAGLPASPSTRPEAGVPRLVDWDVVHPAVPLDHPSLDEDDEPDSAA